jgi:hypothetical protein
MPSRAAHPGRRMQMTTMYGDKSRVVFYTDPETARRLRVLAALKETSVSSYVNDEVVKPHVDNLNTILVDSPVEYRAGGKQ